MLFEPLQAKLVCTPGVTNHPMLAVTPFEPEALWHSIYTKFPLAPLRKWEDGNLMHSRCISTNKYQPSQQAYPSKWQMRSLSKPSRDHAVLPTFNPQHILHIHYIHLHLQMSQFTTTTYRPLGSHDLPWHGPSCIPKHRYEWVTQWKPNHHGSGHNYNYKFAPNRPSSRPTRQD